MIHIGVTIIPETRPGFIVSPAEFAGRAGVDSVTEEVIHRRKNLAQLFLTLVAPVLSGGD